jgi:FKBP-type peptidyl-prolyl cis-trans isomerase
VFVIAPLSCSKVEEPGKSDFVPAEASVVDVPPAPETLQSVDLVVGKGRAVASGDSVSVHYTGTLLNGKKFDSSLDRKQPFDFTVGKSQVIKGWDQGVVGMQVGGKRKLTIPAPLAYGSQEKPGIPANSALVFEIELLSIK